ncbi:MAG: RNA polymerase factor sigma-32 [Bdellovibrionales bacterium]|nr:RNA polymerase factor sigma-32 [Bdellovibrionales bacterium]
MSTEFTDFNSPNIDPTESDFSGEDTTFYEQENLDPLDKEAPALLEPSNQNKMLTPTSDPLTRYLSELRKYPLLSREEENRLARKYRETGDPKSAEILVTSNLRFVVKVATEYTKFGAKLIDLIQEGNVGLMHAVREFNPYKGVRLITYAVWWIRGYIQEYLMRQYSMVRIGTTATQRKLFYQLQKQKEELERVGYDQAIAQLSGKLGVEASEVSMMQQRMSSRDVSLDKPLSESQKTTLLNMQKSLDEESIDERLGKWEEIQILKEKIAQLRPELTEREQIILDSRLLAEEPATLQEIGDKYHITREAIRQMEQRLIEKIKQRFANTQENNLENKT